MKRLSVIIPGYNTPKKLWYRCVKSALNALGKEDEVICVDDGSSIPVEMDWLLDVDNKDDSRVSLLRLDKNCGLPTARNKAIEIAKGQYVTFMDSDDEIITGVYDQGISTLEKYQSDIVVFGVRCVWTDIHLFKNDEVEEKDLGTMNAQQIAWLFNACTRCANFFQTAEKAIKYYLI